jgi:hypothetical protein
MNSALTHNQAASKTGRIARTALRGALACALIVGGGFTSGTAFAQQYGDRRDDPQQQQQQPHQGGRDRFTLPQQDRGQRDAEMRAYEEQQRRSQQPPRDDRYRGDDRNRGRLTPDERRDLRRQINEAGQDLYPRGR